jgi:hypothetical protein
MNEVLNNASLKRFILSLATLATIALNKKMGLQLDPVDIAALASFALGYVIQSATKEVKMAGVDAAAKVVTKADAVAEISK